MFARIDANWAIAVNQLGDADFSGSVTQRSTTLVAYLHKN
jgi:hypothetical protein